MTAIRDVLKREIKALAFDQYGTIVDMQKGLVEAATPFLKAKGWDGKPNSFVTWWRRTHYENSMIDALCDRGHTPYRQIGHRAVSFVMDRCGIAYTQDEVKALVGEIERLKPFPDVVAALGSLRSAGYKLAILSNGDRDMLKAAGPHIGFAFDHVISVQEAGYFKPHWKTYAKAERDHRRGPVGHPVRRQPCLRLHRREILRHAHGLHRPPQAAVRRDAAPARPHPVRLRRARRYADIDGWSLLRTLRRLELRQAA